MGVSDRTAENMFISGSVHEVMQNTITETAAIDGEERVKVVNAIF